MVYGFYRSEVCLKKGAKEYLEEAKRLGFSLCVTTALSRRNAEASLVHTGIRNMFDFVITLEDLGNKTDKGSPDIFLRATDYISAPGIVVTPDKEQAVLRHVRYMTTSAAEVPMVGRASQPVVIFLYMNSELVSYSSLYLTLYS